MYTNSCCVFDFFVDETILSFHVSYYLSGKHCCSPCRHAMRHRFLLQYHSHPMPGACIGVLHPHGKLRRWYADEIRQQEKKKLELGSEKSNWNPD